MKTFQKFTILLFMALAFTACSSDDDNATESGQAGGEGGATGEEYFRASVDGQPFAADTDLASLIGGQINGSGAGTILTGQGSTNNGTFINFNIIGYNGVGTYPVGDDISNQSGITYGELSGTNVSAWVSNGIIAITGLIEPGSIVVTSQDDDGAQGTFSFQGYNGVDETTKNITSGEFKIIFDN
ncbi:MAG: hypothetical protein ACI849_001041 [Patiriisocius sp.]|jgi:hypothetical protein